MGLGPWRLHKPWSETARKRYLSIINIQHIPLQDSQRRFRELRAQHRTGSVLDLAWHLENSQEVLEPLLLGEAYWVVRMEGFEAAVAGTAVAVEVAVAAVAGSGEYLEGIDQREEGQKLVVHKHQQEGDLSRGHQSSCVPQLQSSNPTTAR